MKRSSGQAITGWKAVLLAPILLPIGLIMQLWPGAAKVDRTPDEVAGFLRGILDDTLGEWDWDGFETTPIKDPELDWIRKRAAMAAPPNPDLAVLRELLTETEQIIERRASGPRPPRHARDGLVPSRPSVQRQALAKLARL